MTVVAKPLVDSLQRTIPMLVRRVAPTGDYLESVLSAQDLSRCFDLLAATFGPPVKDFGKAATAFDPPIKEVVDGVGGIRLEQCLFVKRGEQRQVLYAALWPWASDASRVTLKVGIVVVSQGA